MWCVDGREHKLRLVSADPRRLCDVLAPGLHRRSQSERTPPMDATRFDRLTRALTEHASRRTLLAGLGGSVSTLLSRVRTAEDAEAKSRKGKGKKKKRHQTPPPADATDDLLAPLVPVTCSTKCGDRCCTATEHCCNGQCVPNTECCGLEPGPVCNACQSLECAGGEWVCLTTREGQPCGPFCCKDGGCGTDGTDFRCCGKGPYCTGFQHCCNEGWTCNGNTCKPPA
jgi:hypothetical protein